MGISTAEYGSASGVASLAMHLMEQSSTSNFSASTRPSLTQVNSLLLQGAQMMDMEMAGKGFTTPVSDTTLRGLFGTINNLWAAGMAFTTRTINRSYVGGPEDDGKGGMWLKAYRQQMDKLLEKNGAALSGLGLSRGTALSYGLEAPSISIADKEDAWDDSDFDKPAFTRGLFKYTDAAS